MTDFAAGDRVRQAQSMRPVEQRALGVILHLCTDECGEFHGHDCPCADDPDDECDCDPVLGGCGFDHTRPGRLPCIRVQWPGSSSCCSPDCLERVDHPQPGSP